MDTYINPIKVLIADLNAKGVKAQDAVISLEVMLNHRKIVAPGMTVIKQLVEDYYQQHSLTAEESTPLPISKPYDRDISGRVRQWVEKADGVFHHDDVFRELEISNEDRPAARAALQRMAANRDLIERYSAKRGWYRRIDDNLQKVDYLNATGKEYPIILPFNLHNWVQLYPKSIVIIAGSSNAGKSALLLNVVRDNMHTHKIRYFTSEFSADDLKIRLDNFGIDLEDWVWDVYERSRDFHDVIDPEGLNIIDYMDVPEGLQSYEMNKPIDKIFQRLTTGIALIALQKRPGKDSAVGGEATIERARLAINMDRADISKGEVYNTLTIKKAKIARYPPYSPNGWTWQYKLKHGTTFEVVTCTDAELAERELRKHEGFWEGE